MKILITGSNGLLGQKLVYALKERSDVDVVATSFGENRIHDKEGYTYEVLDVTDENQVQQIIGKHRPNCVINTAAMTNVDACEAEKERCVQMNINAIAYLIKACEQYGIHFVQLSTDFVFDGEQGPYKEEDLPHPISYYGWSKFEAEKLVQKSKIKWTIVRTIIIYGIVDNMSRSNVVLWAKDALSKGQPINVVDDQFRSPTLAEDLAQACISIALKGAIGIYHVSGPETLSILELVNRVADFYGLDKSGIKPTKSISLNQAAKRPPRTGFIIDKAIKELDYKPHSFEQGLAILAQQLRERGLA